MKKIILKLTSITLIFLLLGLAYCKKDVIYNSTNTPQPPALNTLQVDAGFNYRTTIETDFTIKTIDLNGKFIANARIDIYSDYTKFGGSIITSGTTDENGIFKTLHPLPAFYKDIVIASKYPGIEGEYKLQIDKGKVNYTITQNKPLTKSQQKSMSDLTTDTDNDGVADIDDDYPNDFNKAFNSYFPMLNKTGTLAFEDLWPYKGDYDFNDLVIDYNFNEVLNGQEKISEVHAMFIIKAMGASYANGYGLQLNIPSSLVSSVSGTKLTDNYINVGTNGTELNQTKAVIIVIDNAYAHFRNISGTNPYGMAGYNTSVGGIFGTPDTINIVIHFTEAVEKAVLGNPPYNSFIIANKRRGYEIHLPDMPPTDLANMSLFNTGDDNSNGDINRYYKNKNNLPWAINLSQSFSYPTEKSVINYAYLKFASWAESNGTAYTDWFSNTNSSYRNTNYIYH